ncbi:hypothetical protein E2C01_091476 [Portunus trituberculatus]|uniref:Uncharacterized protein n=1 Tax=Portunus trituberculatus TaxID=210409 RepID=A0A5B7JE20_PORTR|nr:hypothetical protein [Portunus trituberculatus]
MCNRKTPCRVLVLGETRGHGSTAGCEDMNMHHRGGETACMTGHAHTHSSSPDSHVSTGPEIVQDNYNFLRIRKVSHSFHTCQDILHRVSSFASPQTKTQLEGVTKITRDS